MNYAITAATGNFGQTAVRELLKLATDNHVIAIVRNTEKAKALFPQDVEIRQGDYADEASMQAALQNVDRLLFISSQPGEEVTREEQHRNVVKAMTANKVKFVAYTSFPNAQQSTSGLANDHRLTEEAITNTGIKHAFLRNNWYLENEIGFLKTGAANQLTTYWANGKAGWALEREFATAAAKVLTLSDPKEVYEFAGKARSYTDLGATLKQATGNDFEVKQVTAKEYQTGLEKSGLNGDMAALFTSFQEPINDGSLNENSNDLEKVLGHELTSLPDAINEILNRN
ncbi:SDR family oxidoreductase [Pediococcus ethanolidurans]|uniref:SDR family oxidoreductase n=1 Tax=Pediococcus ethanolidurans TaxID=319653 RepID=UPI0021E71A25|nr:SDR family oxidoreductase [Pediococcus ethanolidurans]MCV3316213.1 SDR family oxidoreductase [Pediococcus ethanolidurans]MCV3327271.1 SDR family oxidoreductase [Pediococcus ethanolidurans]